MIEQNIVLAAAIIGFVNAVQMTYPKVTGIYALLVALVLGLIAGYFGIFGTTIEVGIVTAFASSGFYKLTQKLSGK